MVEDISGVVRSRTQAASGMVTGRNALTQLPGMPLVACLHLVCPLRHPTTLLTLRSPCAAVVAAARVNGFDVEDELSCIHAACGLPGTPGSLSREVGPLCVRVNQTDRHRPSRSGDAHQRACRGRPAMEEALLADAQRERATGDQLLRRAADLERRANTLGAVATMEASEVRASLSEDAAALCVTAQEHFREAARKERVADEFALGPEPRDTTCTADALLKAATVGAAVLIPGGVPLLASAMVAAPYVGIDPAGTASRRVCATLRKNREGLFLFELAETPSGGLVISELRPSDVEDERGLLRCGDELRSIDGALVGHSRCPADTDQPRAGLSFDESLRLAKGSGETILVEVWREAVRPLMERAVETKQTLESDVRQLMAACSPREAPLYSG